MIIGHGDIASVLKEQDKYNLLFFAAGVSNSAEQRESEYKRELLLLTSQPKDKRLVYFSSLCIFYKATRYALHKREMEFIIKRDFPYWTIVRLGNISWGVNPHTIINFLKNKLRDGQSISIEPVYRYVVDLNEFLHWIDLIPPWNCEMNIPGRMMRVSDIVGEFCL